MIVANKSNPEALALQRSPLLALFPLLRSSAMGSSVEKEPRVVETGERVCGPNGRCYGNL